MQGYRSDFSRRPSTPPEPHSLIPSNENLVGHVMSGMKLMKPGIITSVGALSKDFLGSTRNHYLLSKDFQAGALSKDFFGS